MGVLRGSYIDEVGFLGLLRYDMISGSFMKWQSFDEYINVNSIVLIDFLFPRMLGFATFTECSSGQRGNPRPFHCHHSIETQHVGLQFSYILTPIIGNGFI